MSRSDEAVSIRYRRARDTVGIFRKIEIIQDGERVAKLARDSETTVPVIEGEHIVQARMDWASSEPLTVTAQSDRETSVEVSFSFTSFFKHLTKPERAISLRVGR